MLCSAGTLARTLLRTSIVPALAQNTAAEPIFDGYIGQNEDVVNGLVGEGCRAVPVVLTPPCEVLPVPCDSQGTLYCESVADGFGGWRANCVCFRERAGADCSLYSNPCDTFPCNRGVCVQTQDSFKWWVWPFLHSLCVLFTPSRHFLCACQLVRPWIFRRRLL